MLKLGFKLVIDLQHCLGRWGGGGRDSHKTCKRLLITLEITFSYLSLKYYQVSQGIMAIIVGSYMRFFYSIRINEEHQNEAQLPR